MAILGDEHFDVTTIDVPSVRLLGVRPRQIVRADVGSPLPPQIGKTDQRRCAGPPDTYPDLVLVFDVHEVVRAIEAVLGRATEDGDMLALTLAGRLLPAAGGYPIVGEDLVIIGYPGYPRR